MLRPIVQYHGKWPFYRFLGVQEPFSVLFSAMNFAAHWWGQEQIQKRIPADYPLRKWYVAFGYFGYASWTFSMLFHTRDFNLTEKLDYFAAGASVLYGFYYTPIRVFRLDQPTRNKQAFVRLWTYLCVLLFVAHVSYLSFWSWDYTYNMAANVAAGVVQNVLWTYFSIMNYTKTKKTWTAWPGMIVTWLFLAMSLELFDFPPWGGMLDAHSLWHLGTVGPTIWWYRYETPLTAWRAGTNISQFLGQGLSTAIGWAKAEELIIAICYCNHISAELNEPVKGLKDHCPAQVALEGPARPGQPQEHRLLEVISHDPGLDNGA